MAQNPQGFNNGTQSFINFDDAGGTVLTQIVTVGTIQSGTISVLPNLPQGSINVTAGTITGGTLTNLISGTINAATAVVTTLPNIPGGTLTNLISGTINSATTVLNSGTINVATAVITTLPNIPGGTINILAGGTLGILTNGTLSSSGTTTGVGSVSNVGSIGMLNAGTISTLPNIPGGSIVITTGTIAAHAITAATITEGTLRNLISGTINSATAVLNSGTINVATAVITTLPNIPGGTINILAGGTLGILSQGSINVTAGTVTAGTLTALANGTITAGTLTSITNLAAGTITALATGTLTGGTLKDNFAAVGTFTITVAALASSTAGVGRQATLIDNTTNLYSGALIGAQITTGSVTTANQLISLYLIRSDNASISDDNAGTGDAAWTQMNAPLLGNILIPTVGTAIQYEAVFDTSGVGHLGPKWGIGVVQSTGNNLHATAGSHSITYTQYNARF